MYIKELIERIEARFPISLQEKWDNSGFIIGDKNNSIKNVLVCLEITPETIDFAIEKNCNFIIAHHPLIFTGLKKIDMSFKGSKIQKLVKHDISVYATHTSIDVNGLNDYIFNKIGFKSQGYIEETESGFGYGSMAKVDILDDEIISKIKKNLELDFVIKYGINKKYKKVGLVTGSGTDFIDQAIKKGIDLFITGDITHHDAMDSVEKGVDLIDISHEGSEKFFAEFMKNYIDGLELDINVFSYYNLQKYKAQLR